MHFPRRKSFKQWRFLVSMAKILVTSALPYVNNVPHLGNLIGAVLSADVFARFHRSIGSNIKYVCGTDENGTTTEKTAMEQGLTPKELCDKYYQVHKKIYEWFNISFDVFGRTSTEKHNEITQSIFANLDKNGYIREEDMELMYDPEKDMFLADRFVQGTCPHCQFEQANGDQCDNCGHMLNPTELVNPVSKLSGATPVKKVSRHLFLDLPKIKPLLEEWMQTKSKVWSQNARTMTEGWLKDGLKPRCITRDLKWGVPVPKKGFENKVFYVWFDACIGYISITAKGFEDWKEWWFDPEVELYQFMGKDNIPFHTIIFPSSLLADGRNWTTLHQISSTEYLNYESGKFSKSNKIGVFGDDAINSGIKADVFRYYLLNNRPESSDTVFTWKDFQEKNNNELVANLGNLVNRTLMFIERSFEGNIPVADLNEEDKVFLKNIKGEFETVKHFLLKAELKQGLKQIMHISKLGNQYFQANEPWKLIKDDPNRARAVLFVLVALVKDLGILIQPYLPDTSKTILSYVNGNSWKWDDLGKFSVKGKISRKDVLFEKIDNKKIEELHSKYGGKQEKKGFDLLNLKVAEIVNVEKHPDAEKLYIETIDLGNEQRKIVSGLAGYYTPEELVGKKVIVVTNLEPAKLRGVVSKGMLLAVAEGDKLGVLEADAPVGTQVIIEGSTPNTNQISIKQFAAVKLVAKEDGVYFEDKHVQAGSKNITVDRGCKGKIS